MSRSPRLGGFVATMALALAGCQSIPPAPNYTIDRPDDPPPAHRALLERDRERAAAAHELLAKPEDTSSSRASLLLNRATARLTLGQYAAAVSDLQEAIRLAPGSVDLRLQLARTLWVLDREMEALEQVAAARSLDSLNAEVSMTAGMIEFAAGRWATAANEFDFALANSGGNNGYMALFLSFARLRVPGTAPTRIEGPVLRAMDAGFELWPAPIAEALLGRMPADELRRRARHPEPLVERVWQTEVAFYLGELAAHRGDQAAALELYREALRQGVPHEFEYILARARLRAAGDADPEMNLVVIEDPETTQTASAENETFDAEFNETAAAELEINRLVRSGSIDRAIIRLRELAVIDPSVERLRALAALQVESGRATAALESWRASLRGDSDDWQALAAIGSLELQLALAQGTSAQGTPISNALSAAFDPWTYLSRREGDRHLAAAREAFDRARVYRPDDLDLARTTAQLRQFSRDHAGALELWRQVRAAAPDDLDARIGEAVGLSGLGRHAEARPLIDGVLERESNHAGARAALAEVLRRTGQGAEARRQGEWAQFAAQLPPGSRLEFSPINVEYVNKVATAVLRFGPLIVMIHPDTREGLVQQWRESILPQHTELLAAAWWNAPPEGAANVELARELLERGKGTMLRAALAQGSNPVAAGAAAHALAATGDVTIVDRLIDLLRQDQERLRPGDFAGALGVLGEYRATMPLAAVLDPDFRSSPRFSFAQFEQALGYRAARARAALALAAFDSEYARAALETGTHNPEVALHCHAALFVQTKDRAHWDAIASALRFTDFLEARRTFELLRKTGDSDAIEVADAWDKRIAAAKLRRQLAGSKR